MAESLSAFFAQNARKVENRKVVISDRFVGADGNPAEWEIACISASDNQKLRNASMRSQPTGKRGQYAQTLDTAAYQAKLAVTCVVYPDLNNTELQSSYGALSAEQLISQMLTPGEFDDLILAIVELNGFTTEGELVEEAKN